ncbi:MAG: PmoA family protein [Chthoniobacteraceae bacterium]
MRSLSRTLWILAGLASGFGARADVTVTPLDDRVRIDLNGQHFTDYRFVGAPHVYYWPLMGPNQVQMTRAWPMAEVDGEDRDHVHHRSFWFAHGLVNGIDFWGENASYKGNPKHPVGTIQHAKIVEAKSGPEVGVLTTAQNWVAPDGSIPLTGEQTLRVHDVGPNERLFDFNVTLTAGAKDVVLGDTKEGTAALRIAESMRLKQPKGKVSQGHILNSEGRKDSEVWGKRAKWVAMDGPIDGKTYDIAFMEHPSNPRSPTRWHARDYGLFAANPFCEHEMDPNLPAGSGDFTLKSGQSITLKYRIWIHEGAADQAAIEKAYSNYVQQTP